MEASIGAASGLISSVVKQLSAGLVEAYVASAQLGLNSTKIKDDLMYMQGLLQVAETTGVSDNAGLQGLLQRLTTKADEAEDALDELNYFIIQDRLDGTKYAEPDLGDGLRDRARHGRHALRHTVGNCLKCFSCSPMQDDDDASAAVTSNPHNITKPDSGGSDGPVDKLSFDRVKMSNKIKSVMEEIHSLCNHVSTLLNITPHYSSTTNVTLNRPLIGSTIVQDKLYGRSIIFEQTIKDITCGTYHGEALSVLPIVGPGGIGKTTFTQHLYNDRRTEEHFTVRVWVCVSTDFDVLKLTQQIHSCIPPTEKEDNNIASGTTNLNQLQTSIAHRLKSKRFLIVLDDIWKCTDVEWNGLLAPFTKGEAKGSMVLVTTRLSIIEKRVTRATSPINLQGLEPEEFFKFFLACVFGENKPDQKYNELIDIGREIAEKLKCSPLAAKTVAPLLKKDLSWEHWRKVLENNEWKDQANSDDIMPALKISYDYLPFYLKQCFSFFSLFPEDHRFNILEITRFWTAIGIIDSSCKNRNYLEELVDNGFLMKEVDDDLEDQCYVMHDLLHELSQSVSSQECVNISSLSFRADAIPQSIRHLSITIEDRFDENFRKEMAKLKSRINIGNLRTLMIFRRYDERIAEILKDTFEEIEGLRVLFIVMTSPESLPNNFSKLLHLRYLKLGSPPHGLEISLPCTVSRFYHLIFLDLEDWYGSSTLPKHISRLVNLRLFIAQHELHSNVPEVGKIEHLEELKEFHVKKEGVGFDLSELGKLTDLGGELRICNLEKVATKEEASQANLALKRNLKSLTLVWGREKPVVDADVVDGLQPHDNPVADVDVVDGLQPHDNLSKLAIKDQCGVIGPPNWLCGDITIKHLESLTLEGVSWGTLPPFGQLPYLKILRLKNISGVRLIGYDLNFMHLKEVEFINMPDLEKWVAGTNCHLFPMLESIQCRDCPNFLALPFLLECLAPCTQDIHYPRLSALHIDGCPKLSLPPMPHTSTLTSVQVHDGPGNLRYWESGLHLNRYSGALAFHNMDKLEGIWSEVESNIPWTELEKLTSLMELDIEEDPSMQSMAPLSNLTSLTSLRIVDCENLRVDGFNPLITAVNLKELRVFNRNEDGNRPRSVAADLLSEMAISADTSAAASSFQLEELWVDSISAVLVAPICTLLAPTLTHLGFYYDHRRVDSLREEEEKALQLLTSLQSLQFYECRGLPSLPQGLHSLPSLTELWVWKCPGIRSLAKELPTSLRHLEVTGCNPKLKEQAEKLKVTNPDLRVIN